MGFQDDFSDSNSSNEECPWIDHELILCSADGQEMAAEGTKYRITFADGAIEEGELDGSGSASHKKIARGAVTIEYEPDIWEEIEKTRAEIQCLLDDIITAEEKEKAELEKKLAEKSWLGRQWAYQRAELKGFYTAAKDTVVFAGKVIYEVGKRAGAHYFFSETASKDAAALAKAWNKVTNIEINSEEVLTYMLLAIDLKTWEMLLNFADDFIDAQHEIEKREFGGQVAFEIIFALITAGAGLAANARHLGKLKKISKLLKELAEKIKRSLRSFKKTDKTHKKTITKLNASDLQKLNAINADRKLAKANGWKHPDNKEWDWWPDNKKDFDKVPGTIVKNHPVKEGKYLTRYVRKNGKVKFDKSGDGGTYFSPHPPDIPFEQRALPGKESDYFKVTFRVKKGKELNVNKSEATPWFDQPGHGIQYDTGIKSKMLTDDDNGILEVVKWISG